MHEPFYASVSLQPVLLVVLPFAILLNVLARLGNTRVKINTLLSSNAIALTASIVCSVALLAGM